MAGLLFAPLLALPVLGCAREPSEPVLRPLPVAAAEGSLAPRLARGGDGVLRLSWVEPLEAGGGHALALAPLGPAGWSEPRRAAWGAGWFVNWADVPASAALADGTLLATLLVKTSEDTYAYEVRIARSTDGGGTWSEPRVLHDDVRPAEHGFVSLVPLEGGRFLAVWLDGRETAAATGEGGHGAHGGAMTLRSREVARDGTLGPETLLDGRVCDCCWTAAVRTPEGVLVAYRDRSEDEVRDISLVRIGEAGAGEPRPLARDGWRIEGCPVNGPALASRGELTGAAWFTAADDRPRVLAALSTDGGRTFGEPLTVSDVDPEGRAGVALAAGGGLWVSWLERSPEGARWLLRRMAPGPPGEPLEVAAVPAARSSGVAQLAADGGDLVLAWTDPGPPSRVRAVRIALGAGD